MNLRYENSKDQFWPIFLRPFTCTVYEVLAAFENLFTNIILFQWSELVLIVQLFVQSARLFPKVKRTEKTRRHPKSDAGRARWGQ